MKKIDFNQAWTYCRVGEETVKCEVMMPHDAMISEKRTEDSAGGINTGWFEGYDYIYEKEFEIRMNMKNRKSASNSRVFTIMRKCI